MLLVTACVDRICRPCCAHTPTHKYTCVALRLPYIEVDRDIVLEGHVSWVGRSSIEASIQCMQHTPADGWRQALEAKFVMVALDPMNSGK
jgi:acyl-CoA hydrolase